MKKIVYLANPYGFSTQMQERLLPEIASEIASMGLEVWEPFERNNTATDETGHNPISEDTAMRIAFNDIKDVQESDAIFAIVNGEPPDVGVAVEIGLAIAFKKPVFLFRDDFRVCRDTHVFPLNLMLFGGCLQSNWREYYYTSVADITNPKKALAKWASIPKVKWKM